MVHEKQEPRKYNKLRLDVVTIVTVKFSCKYIVGSCLIQLLLHGNFCIVTYT